MSQDPIQSLIEASIPIAGQAMGLRILERADDHVCLALPLAANANDKGTAFAGSIYSACVLSGWVLAMHTAMRCNFPKPWAAIVDSHCSYTKAIKSDVQTRATFIEPPELTAGARNYLKIKVEIDGCVAFTGSYAVGIRH